MSPSKNQIAKVEASPSPAEYFTPRQIELIKRQICPGASDDELQMFLADCQRSRLDPFARQIYSIERSERYRDPQGNWKTRKKRVTQYSIDGFRLLAERTGEYAGQLGPEWCGPDGQWRDVWLGEGEPAAARVAALRKDFEKPLWTPAVFNEYAVRYDGKLSGLWAKMPAVMIAKCAEALALRRAFPNELGGRYTGDEMMQAGEPHDVTPRPSLADELDDQIPDYDQADAARSGSGAAAGADGTESPPLSAPALSLEDMAREAAKRGPDTLRAFFAHRNSDEKKRLRKIEAELVALYPPLTEGGK